MGVWTDRRAFADVLAATRAGDEVAFTALWRWLNPPLVRWLAVVSPGSIDDVASEVWLSILRGLPRFEGAESEFRGWAFTLARRRAIDLARRQRRRPPSTPFDGIDVADASASASASVDAAGDLATALALLRGLTLDQREVVALRTIGGLSVAETAAVVGKSEGAVRVLCHRGLRALAQVLVGDDLVGGRRP